MGLDANGTATFKGQSSVGRVQLETDHVLFRGSFRVRLALSSITSVTSTNGTLSLTTAEGTLVIGLGAAADKWAARIRSPRSRIEKLGVKAGMRVSLAGVNDAAFIAELQAAGADISPGLHQQSDQIYAPVESARDLHRLKALVPALAPDGALWIIRRKGLADASEAATMAAGLAAGLVDVKVARFSDTHTAEKFVRRRIDRRLSAQSNHDGGTKGGNADGDQSKGAAKITKITKVTRTEGKSGPKDRITKVTKIRGSKGDT